MPLNKLEFDQIEESELNQTEMRKKRCNWNQLLKSLNLETAYSTDEIRAITIKHTVDGKQMSRLRCRNFLLNLVKDEQATRKYIDGKHYYLVKRSALQSGKK